MARGKWLPRHGRNRTWRHRRDLVDVADVKRRGVEVVFGVVLHPLAAAGELGERDEYRGGQFAIERTHRLVWRCVVKVENPQGQQCC